MPSQQCPTSSPSCSRDWQELGDQVSAAVDAVQTKIDEVQAAWDARGSE